MLSRTRLLRAFASFLASERAASPSRAPLPNGVFSLAHLGLPELYGARCVPTVEVRSRHEASRQLKFPERCVGCGLPAEVHLSLFRERLLRHPLTLLERVPHCRRHAAVGPLLAFETSALGDDRVWELVAPDMSVLEQTLALNAAGDHLPPWQAFPALSPESSGWRQGEGEDWLGLAWLPFWSKLGTEARADYLRRWPAPAEWEGALLRLPAFAGLLTA